MLEVFSALGLDERVDDLAAEFAELIHGPRSAVAGNKAEGALDVFFPIREDYR